MHKGWKEGKHYAGVWLLLVVHDRPNKQSADQTTMKTEILIAVINWLDQQKINIKWSGNLPGPFNINDVICERLHLLI